MDEYQGTEKLGSRFMVYWCLPWTCGQRLSCLLPLGDEGIPDPGLSGPDPQFLLEAAPQHHPPSLGMSGLHLPCLPAGGVSGPLCWSLGAGESQESSERDPGSSPEKGKEEKPVKGKADWGSLGPDAAEPSPPSPCSPCSPSILPTLPIHPPHAPHAEKSASHAGLPTSTATFSFSIERLFRGAVTATPSNSAFFRSSSIS